MPIKPYQTQPVAPYTAPNLRCGMVLRVTKDIGQVSKVGDYLVVGGWCNNGYQCYAGDTVVHGRSSFW